MKGSTLPRNSARKTCGDHPDPSLDNSSFPRLPLCPIPESAHNPIVMADSTDHPPSTPPAKLDSAITTRTKAKENTDVPPLTTPDKRTTPFLSPSIVSSKFGWYQHRNQTSSSNALHENSKGDAQTDFSTPPRYSCSSENQANSGINAQLNRVTPRSAKSMKTSINENDSASIGGTPGRNVSRSLKYNQQATSNANHPVHSGITHCRQNGTSNSLVRPVGLLQLFPGHSSQSSVQNCTEVPHFEIEEDPSFWNDHNVQVLIRIRPFNDVEIAGQGYSRCIRQESAHTLTWIGPPESRFTFDHVACDTITQEKLFKVAGFPMVENCMSGYNSCMFAYGQTGSGKTYTMLGDVDELDYRPSENRGMTPRIFEYLFSKIQMEEASHQHDHLKYACKCSFLEIYNEQITDLLEPTSTNLQMREDIKKGVYVENLSEFEVKCVEDVAFLLLQGAANRRVAATNMNRESSRSHSVFTCVIESEWTTDSVTNKRFGRLNLVDLAGSERQKSSGAEGERLKEAANINKSLSTLGLVIMILVDVAHGKQRHVPYRDSKLTFLLQDSLGGNSKTTIIANVSPSICSAYETLSTLKFAQRAKFIHNNAVVNEDASGDVIALRLQIQQLKDELNRLRSQTLSSVTSFRATEASFPDENFESSHKSLNSRDTGEDIECPKLSNTKAKMLEAILAGALRREQKSDNATKVLAAQIEQLNRLVRQREEDTRCGKMMLRFREEKIRKLELAADRLMPTESYLMEENNALKEELHMLRARVDRNPEVTRFAMENIRLVEQLRRFQEFYGGGEREVMQEEISMLRDQLLDVLEGKFKLDVDPQRQTSDRTEASVNELANAAKENELLRTEVENYKKELQEYRSNLSTYIDSNSKMTREISELKEQADRLKAELHDLKVSKDYIAGKVAAYPACIGHLDTVASLKAAIKEKDERLETERKLYDDLNKKLVADHEEDDLLRKELKMELETINDLLEAERASSKVVVETVVVLHKQLEESHERERELSKQLAEGFQKLDLDRTVIEAFENQQIVLNEKLTDFEMQNKELTEVVKKNEEEVQLLRGQVRLLEDEIQKMLEARLLAVEKNSASVDSNIKSKLEETRRALRKAQQINAKLKSDEASRLAMEQENNLVQADAETEMINTITSLQSELLCLEKDVAASRKEGSGKVDQLTRELDHLQTRYTELLAENGQLAEVHEILKHDNDDYILASSRDAERIETNLFEFLADGSRALDEAVKEVDNIIKEPGYAYEKTDLHLIKKDDALDIIHKHLVYAQMSTKDTKNKVRDLTEATVVVAEQHRKEKQDIENNALAMRMNATGYKLEIQKYNKMLVATFVVISRLSEKCDELVASKTRMENQLIDCQEENLDKQNLLKKMEGKLENLQEDYHSFGKRVYDKEILINNLQEQVNVLRYENASLINGLESLKKEYDLLAVEADEIKLARHNLQNMVNDLTSENVSIEREAELLKQKCQELVVEATLRLKVTYKILHGEDVNVVKTDQESFRIYEQDNWGDQLVLMLVEREISKSLSESHFELLQDELKTCQSNLQIAHENIADLMVKSEEMVLEICNYQRNMLRIEVLQNHLGQSKIECLRAQKMGAAAFIVVSKLSEKSDELAMAENMVMCLLDMVSQEATNKQVLELAKEIRDKNVTGRGIQKQLNLLYEMQQSILEESQFLQNGICEKKITIDSLEEQVKNLAYDKVELESKFELLREERESSVLTTENKLKYTRKNLEVLESELEKAVKSCSILSCENDKLVDQKILLLLEKEMSELVLRSQFELLNKDAHGKISIEKLAKEKVAESMATVETMAIKIASLENNILNLMTLFDQNQMELRRSEEVTLLASILVTWLLNRCDELTAAQGKFKLFQEALEERLANLSTKVDTMGVEKIELKEKIRLLLTHISSYKITLSEAYQMAISAFILVGRFSERTSELVIAEQRLKIADERLQGLELNLRNSQQAYSLLSCQRDEWAHEKIMILVEFEMHKQLWESELKYMKEDLQYSESCHLFNKKKVEELMAAIKLSTYERDERLEGLELKLKNIQQACSILSWQRDEWAHEKVMLLVELEMYKQLMESELKCKKEELQSSESCHLFNQKKVEELVAAIRSLTDEKAELEAKLKKSESLHKYAYRCVRDLQESQKMLVGAFSVVSWLSCKLDETIEASVRMTSDLEVAASIIYKKENQLAAMAEEMQRNSVILSEMKGDLQRMQDAERHTFEEKTLLGRELHDKEATIQDLQEEMNCMTCSKAMLENDIELLEKEYRESIKEIECRLNIAERKLEGKEFMQEQLNCLTSENVRLEEEVLLLGEKNEAALREAEKNLQLLEEYEQGMMSMEKQLDDLKSQKTVLEVQINLCKEGKEEAQKQLKVAEENLLCKASIEEEVHHLVSDNARLLREIQFMKQESSRLSEENKYKLKQLEENREKEESEFRMSEEHRSILSCEIDKLAKEKMVLQRNMDQLKAELLELITDLKRKEDDMRMIRLELQNSCEIIEEVRGSHLEAVKSLQERELVIAELRTQVRNLEAISGRLQEENCRRETAIKEWLNEMKKQEESFLEDGNFLLKKNFEDTRVLILETRGLEIQFLDLQEKVRRNCAWLADKAGDDIGAIFSEGCQLVLSEAEHLVNACKTNAAAGWEKAEQILDEKCLVEKELERKEEMLRGLEESMVALKRQADETHSFATDPECSHKQVYLIRMQSKMDTLEAENLELREQLQDLIVKAHSMEVELEDKRQKIQGPQLQLLHKSSLLEQEIARSVGSINRELDLVIKERDELHTELVVLTEQLEMAQCAAEDQEAVAVEARQVAEMSKAHAKQREEEVKLLQQSVEELESTVNALETQVGIAKVEVDRQRLMREDVELELQALNHHISSIQAVSGNQLHNQRALELQLLEARKEIKDLQREAIGKNEQIRNCKANILELIAAAERQNAEHQLKLKELEVMADQVKPGEGKLGNVPLAGKVEKASTRARGPGSPFKCIKSGLSQQMSSELDEELCISRQRIEELEHLAAERQKEIFMLNARLAEAESMTHDVIRDLLGVKLDITSYASMLCKDKSKKVAGLACFNAENNGEKEQELVSLKSQLIEFIKERESWLDEITRRQAEMVTARVTAEKLRQHDEVLSAENEQLKVENASQKKRLVELEEEVNKLSGQQNLQQRIHHHAKIKEENNCLRIQNEDLSSRLGRAEILLNRVSKELARYRAADGKTPFVNIDEEERLERKVREAEDERMQVAKKLLSLCTSILQAAGATHPAGEVDPTAALDALRCLQDRVSSAERELSDLKLKNKIDGEKRRLSELRSIHSPLQA